MGLSNFFHNIADRIRKSPTEFRRQAVSSPTESIDEFIQPANVDTGFFSSHNRLAKIGSVFGFNRRTRTGKLNQAYTAGITQTVTPLRNFTALADGNFRTRVTIRNPQTGIIETKTLDLTREQARQFENNPQGYAESNLQDLSKYVGRGFEVVSWENY